MRKIQDIYDNIFLDRSRHKLMSISVGLPYDIISFDMTEVVRTEVKYIPSQNGIMQRCTLIVLWTCMVLMQCRLILRQAQIPSVGRSGAATVKRCKAAPRRSLPLGN